MSQLTESLEAALDSTGLHFYNTKCSQIYNFFKNFRFQNELNFSGFFDDNNIYFQVFKIFQEFLWLTIILKLQLENNKSNLFAVLNCWATYTLKTQLPVLIKYFKYKKYNCSGTPAFKSQRVGYQSNQKLLHHYQH